MARQSENVVDASGIIVDGFDYDRQVWIKDGRYVACGHPETMACGCFGRAHAGVQAMATGVVAEVVAETPCNCSACQSGDGH